MAGSTDEARRAAACRTFWSDHALNVAYREAVNHRTFSLKEFVQFVVTMPPEQFAVHAGGTSQ